MKSISFQPSTDNHFNATRKLILQFKELLNSQFDLVVFDELFGVHAFALATFFRRYRNVPYIMCVQNIRIYLWKNSFCFRFSTTAMIHSTVHSLALGRNWVSESYVVTDPPNSAEDFYVPGFIEDRLKNIYNIVIDLLSINYYGMNWWLLPTFLHFIYL